MTGRMISARWFAAVVTLVAACGDNLLLDGEPLTPAAALTILAHQDDDLILMQPDLYDTVLRGTGLTNVYVTAGNGKHGLDLAEPRYDGLMAAYAAIAGSSDWACGWIEVAGHAVLHCRLDVAKVSLVFLGYPDGEPDGSTSDSLLHLWQGDVTSARTVARRPTTYDRAGVLRVLTALIDSTQPATLRTLDVAAIHGHDHSDHMMVAALTVLADAAAHVAPELIWYRGYNIEGEPINKDAMLLDRSLDPLVHYEACATGCAPCGTGCAVDKINPQHVTWLSRRYAIGMRRSAAGQLRIGDGCVAATTTGGNPVIVDCAGAPVWQLDHNGTLGSAGRCLDVNFTGEIVAVDCAKIDTGGRFYLDDEGHLWAGVVPPPQADMTLKHLYCVGQAGGRPRAGLCGGDTAPTVQLTRPMVVTPRSIAGITRSGRAVRMASLSTNAPASVCAIEPTRGLICAPGLRDGGGLGVGYHAENPEMPLAIEPESLMLGDIDGDHRMDACGRGATGIECATAASGHSAAAWSPALASTGPATATDRSLAIVDGKICGLTDAGVACIVARGLGFDFARSAALDRGAPLWPAELDGDGDADWCTATPAGPACGLGRDLGTSAEAIPWGYAAANVVEGSTGNGPVPDPGTAVVTDIDGDGRADLCTVSGGAIVCARSLGRSFAPRVPVAQLPAGMAPTSLWADGGTPDQLPRLCAADATNIACVDL